MIGKNKIDKWLDETVVIELIISRYVQRGFHGFPLMNMIDPPIDFEEAHEFKGVYLASNILRTEMGFNKGDKPGDFDLLLIPYNENQVLFKYTTAYEVKIAIPTRKNKNKSANSMGTVQLKGLIEDGFPFVNLMHITMSEALDDHEKDELSVSTIDANSDQELPFDFNLNDHLVKTQSDLLSSRSADNQIKRLLSKDIPKYVGLIAFGMDFTSESDFFYSSSSTEYDNYCSCYFNPKCSKETIEQVIEHFFKHPSKYNKCPYHNASNSKNDS